MKDIVTQGLHQNCNTRGQHLLLLLQAWNHYSLLSLKSLSLPSQDSYQARSPSQLTGEQEDELLGGGPLWYFLVTLQDIHMFLSQCSTVVDTV